MNTTFIFKNMAEVADEAKVHPSWNDYPELEAELDLSKNSGLTFRGKPIKAFELTCGTHKKLDWKCSDCEHEWKAMGSKRVQGHGCHACANQAIHVDGRNSMAKTHPELAIEYQGDATRIMAGTHKKLDWECSDCEHEWKAMGRDRVQGNGCPACFGSLHSDGRNSMANTHPELAIEYQGDATTIIAGTHKKLDWECSDCEHEWKALGSKRVQGRGCPACANQAIHVDGRNSMAKTHPELAIEYQGDATRIMAGTSKKLDWKCSDCEHEWKAVGSSRVQGSGCPACANQAIHVDGRNSMANTHPELAIEYLGDATKIIAGTHKKLDWKCSDCEHEWKAVGSSRVQGNGCHACVNLAIHIDGRNSMANTHPELAIEYLGDATKIIAGTHKKLDWKCSDCEHEWKAVGSSRVQGSGCAACFGYLHSDGRNSMANTHPELAIEYQGDATRIITGTHTKLDWKCSNCEHEWKADSSSRVQGRGCPACSKYGYDPSIIGYVYVHQYQDEINNWLKCGITNSPSDRFKKLKLSAEKFNIEVTELEIYKFDDGFNAQLCESELLSMKSLRFDSGYDVDGKDEFFKYEALDEIKKLILDWL
jgi:Zn finger protein HypA/HybF involved in hydrogenase expression